MEAGSPANPSSDLTWKIPLIWLVLSHRNFWSTHAGAELDLLVFEAGRRIGYEIKHTDAPRMTRSLRIAQTDLKIDDLYVVYPGSEQFPLDDRIHAAGLQGLVQKNR